MKLHADPYFTIGLQSVLTSHGCKMKKMFSVALIAMGLLCSATCYPGASLSHMCTPVCSPFYMPGRKGANSMCGELEMCCVRGPPLLLRPTVSLGAGAWNTILHPYIGVRDGLKIFPPTKIRGLPRNRNSIRIGVAYRLIPCDWSSHRPGKHRIL